jgi:hypothetical protein
VTTTSDVELRDRAVDVLCDRSLAHVVDLVAWPEGDAIVVANADGAARLTAEPSRLRSPSHR